MLDKRLQFLLLTIACLWSTSGCASSKINMTPWYKKTPPEDIAKYGPTANMRIAELKKASQNAGKNSSPAQQEQMAQNLAQKLHTESNPLVRAEIVRTLEHFPSNAAREALHISSKDPNRLVRIACCDTWGRWGTDESAAALGHMVSTELDLDVRLAATKALGDFKRSPAAVAGLAPALEDTDPALQYRAVASLQTVTQEKLGSDVAQWRQYVQARNPMPANSTSNQQLANQPGETQQK